MSFQRSMDVRPCGSCGGRGYVPDEGAGSRACRDCNGDGHLSTSPQELVLDLLRERDAILNKTLTDQRDALADALLACYEAEIAASRTIKNITGVPTPPSEWLAGAEVALRLAGRLPES